MNDLGHHTDTVQSSARAAVVQLHVVSFRSAGGVGVDFLRAGQSDRVPERANGTGGVVDGARVVGEIGVGRRDPDGFERRGGDDGRVVDEDVLVGVVIVDFLTVAEPEDILVGTVGCVRGCGVCEVADGGGDGRELGAQGDIPVGVVFENEGGAGVGSDDPVKDVEVGDPGAGLIFVGVSFLAFGFAGC